MTAMGCDGVSGGGGVVVFVSWGVDPKHTKYHF